MEVENGPPSSSSCFGGVEKACRRAEERQSGEKSIRGLVREEEEEEEKEESGLARERERLRQQDLFWMVRHAVDHLCHFNASCWEARFEEGEGGHGALRSRGGRPPAHHHHHHHHQRRWLLVLHRHF